MAKAAKKQPIENAVEIIERFGGIRPMATKTDIPVTTIQGWKKRGRIPATRREQIEKFARQHDVDIAALFSNEKVAVAAAEKATKVANENVSEAPVSAVTQGGISEGMLQQIIQQAAQEDIKQGVAQEKGLASVEVSFPDMDIDLDDAVVPFSLMGGAAGPVSLKSAARVSTHVSQGSRQFVTLDNVVEDNLMKTVDKKIKDVESRTLTKSTLITAGLIALIVVPLLVVAWPQAEITDAQRRAALATMVEQEQAVAPAGEQEVSLQDRASAAVSSIKSGAASGLESGIASISEFDTMIALSEKFSSLRQSVVGQEQLNIATSELGALFSNIQNLQGNEQINAALDSARGQSAALAETFEGVPTQDLKAAAMLLAMTQMRESLNRDGEAFQDDYVLLRNLVGNDNPELIASLDKLSPAAQSGVLTPEGLGEEFKSLSGEVLVASLKGEDLAVQERAQARMNQLLSAQDDVASGQAMVGTNTELTLARTEGFLRGGNIEAALLEMQNLEGDPAVAAAAWMQKAQTTMNAQNMKVLLNKAIRQTGYGGTKPYNFRKN